MYQIILSCPLNLHSVIDHYISIKLQRMKDKHKQAKMCPSHLFLSFRILLSQHTIQALFYIYKKMHEDISKEGKKLSFILG